MSLKREISASAVASVQPIVKRPDLGTTHPESFSDEKDDFRDLLANLSEQNTLFPGMADHSNMSIQIPHHPITTVLSTAERDFGGKYEIVGELGRGGFSVVYHTKEKSTGKSFAAKIIDLRPLRLREKFDPMRLRREVDIMRQLRHPNIIQFEEVFETPDQLIVVMEFAPGYELFDSILARGFYTEDDARPIFVQIARALQYLHSKDIIHRDIKPENILILREPDTQTGHPIAKLLDFGLSKHTALGSGAKTFVGTPCYLAPEVEFASKGTGATYGSPADCWSLGAVLYVMLVARFPVFEVDVSVTPNRMKLSLPNELFKNSSVEAKDLLLALMNFDPDSRLTARQALSHPWLKSMALPPEDPPTRAAATVHIPVPHSAFTKVGNSPRKAESSSDGSGMDIVRRQPAGTAVVQADQLQLTPLLLFQRNIASCFDEAITAYQAMPEVATEVRRGAMLCRHQLTESTKMLRKIEQTASSVLDMFPDLELAISEGEPQLAAEFFTMVKAWVVELIAMVGTTQKANHASMEQIQVIVEKSTHELHNDMLQKMNALSIVPRAGAATASSDAVVTVGVDNILNATAINTSTLVQMRQMLGTVLKKNRDGQNAEGDMQVDSPPAVESAAGEQSMEHQLLRLFDVMLGRVLDSQLLQAPKANDLPSSPPPSKIGFMSPEPLESSFAERDFAGNDASVALNGQISAPPPLVPREESVRSASSFSSTLENATEESTYNRATQELEHALKMLRQVHFKKYIQICSNSFFVKVDVILEQLSVFWANTEIVLDILTKKGQHAEQFVSFAHKPKLLARFMERVVDYRNFWEGIKTMSQTYLVGVQEPAKKFDRFDSPPGDFFRQMPTPPTPVVPVV
jgi:calcium/calmodulin-dependent protein kinase I